MDTCSACILPMKYRQAITSKTRVGCEQNATGCSALFRVSYLDAAGTPHDLWSLGEFYDGQYFNLDLDLSQLAGQKIQFVLNVGALGSPEDDRALWVDPRIVRFPVAAPSPTLVTNTATPSAAPSPVATPTVTPTFVPDRAASDHPEPAAVNPADHQL